MILCFFNSFYKRLNTSSLNDNVIVELEMQVKKIRNKNSVLLQEAVEPYYIRYIVAKD